MEQHLQFKIGTTFSGEGFTKLKSAVTDVNRTVKGSAGAISAISTEIGMMDSKAAKAVSAITGLINGFMTMNPVLLGITAVISAVSWGMKELKEREEAARKAAEDHRKALEDLATKLNDKIFAKAQKDAAAIGDEFERITKHANALNAAMNALSTEQAKGGVLDIQVQKLNAVVNEITDEGKKLKAAEYDVRIALQKEADIRASETANVEKAHQAVVESENRIANLNEQRAAIETQLVRLQQNNHEVKLAEKSKREHWLKQIEDLQTKMADIDKKIIDEKNKQQVLSVSEQTATQKMANAMTQAAMEVTNAEQAQRNLAKALDDAKETERMRQEAVAHDILQEEELKAQKEAEAAAMKDRTKAESDAATAAKELEQAQAKLRDAIYAYETNYAQNTIWEGIKGGTNSGSTVSGLWRNLNEAGNSQLIQGGAAVIAGERALASGAVRTVDALQRVERQAMRDAREQMSSKETSKMMQEASRAERLRGMSDKAMSQADRDWLAKYDQVEQANDAQRREVEKAKMLEALARARREEAEDAVIKIEQRLRDLGLK